MHSHTENWTGGQARTLTKSGTHAETRQEKVQKERKIVLPGTQDIHRTRLRAKDRLVGRYELQQDRGPIGRTSNIPEGNGGE